MTPADETSRLLAVAGGTPEEPPTPPQRGRLVEKAQFQQADRVASARRWRDSSHWPQLDGSMTCVRMARAWVPYVVCSSGAACVAVGGQETSQPTGEGGSCVPRACDCAVPALLKWTRAAFDSNIHHTVDTAGTATRRGRRLRLSSPLPSRASPAHGVPQAWIGSRRCRNPRRSDVEATLQSPRHAPASRQSRLPVCCLRHLDSTPLPSSSSTPPPLSPRTRRSGMLASSNNHSHPPI